MIDKSHFCELVIQPALEHIGLYSLAAERLLWGTVLHESDDFSYLKQLGGGPALGFYQIEPATHHDIHANFLKYRHELCQRISELVPFSATRFDRDLDKQLITNLLYATVIARLVYFRRPEPLPHEDDLHGLSRYYKQFYNTPKGKATASHWLDAYNRYV